MSLLTICNFMNCRHYRQTIIVDTYSQTTKLYFDKYQILDNILFYIF